MYKFLCLVLLCMFIYILVYMCFFYFFFFIVFIFFFFFFFSSRRRHTRSLRDWSSDVCSSDLVAPLQGAFAASIVAFFSFLGFEAAANMAEEVKNPTRSYPRALFGAILTAAVVYLLIAEIGRASCRERVEVSGGAGASETKEER